MPRGRAGAGCSGQGWCPLPQGWSSAGQPDGPGSSSRGWWVRRGRSLCCDSPGDAPWLRQKRAQTHLGSVRQSWVSVQRVGTVSDSGAGSCGVAEGQVWALQSSAGVSVPWAHPHTHRDQPCSQNQHQPVLNLLWRVFWDPWQTQARLPAKAWPQRRE